MKPLRISGYLFLCLIGLSLGWTQLAVNAATLFSDNFDDGNANGWTATTGSWSVVQDNGSYVYYQSSTNEGRSSTGSGSWTNYTVEAKVKVDNFNGSNRAYLCGRWVDANNYYCASLSSSKLEIRKKVSGSSSTLVSLDSTQTTGTWYTVKLELNGSTIKFYLNGTLKLTASDTSLGSGAIGLIAYKVVAKYDDVVVADLTAGTPTATPATTPTPTVTIKPTATGITPTPTPTRAATPIPTATGIKTGRQMEALDRGLTAVKVSNGVYLSWRLFGTDPSAIAFNVYRNGSKLNSTPLSAGTNYLDGSGTTGSSYSVRPVLNGVEQSASETASVWAQNYLAIPLQIPSGGTTPDGVSYTYSANDCSVGDLDGDHQYEIIVKWDPSNSKDNSQSGYTGNVYLDAYKLNGTRLWRIDLGRNIRAGAHYTQFMVYDLDGDGKAEVACKTADGTKDGRGTVIGSSSADYRNSSGYILSGPEYLTIFNGTTGAALVTTDYAPGRGTVSDWGDSYGNRVDRFLTCIAYLDGVRPSLVMCRGYYTRSVLVAYNWRDGKLTKLWTFDSNSSGNSGYAGQGNHNLSVGDVDGDGYDEIVYGACCIDHNGKGLYTTGLGHGDAMHLSDMDPDRSGLEVWDVHETASSAGGGEFRNAKTGQLLFGLTGSGDTGRGCAANVTNVKGYQMWSSVSGGLYNCKGQNIGSVPASCNFVIWWDGDLQRELLDGTTITKYAGSTLLSASGCASNNGTKATPCLSADLLGDWREEVVFRTSDSSALRIYTTTTATDYRFYTLMHDPQYRLAVAWQNVAYNQPPHPGFYLGYQMAAAPTPQIYLTP